MFFNLSLINLRTRIQIHLYWSVRFPLRPLLSQTLDFLDQWQLALFQIVIISERRIGQYFLHFRRQLCCWRSLTGPQSVRLRYFILIRLVRTTTFRNFLLCALTSKIFGPPCFQRSQSVGLHLSGFFTFISQHTWQHASHLRYWKLAVHVKFISLLISL